MEVRAALKDYAPLPSRQVKAPAAASCLATPSARVRLGRDQERLADADGVIDVMEVKAGKLDVLPSYAELRNWL